MDSMYNILVFEDNIRESDLDVMDLFCIKLMFHKFSIIDTISVDSEYTYVYLLKKYLFHSENQIMII
jgi:hypothetical protein